MPGPFRSGVPVLRLSSMAESYHTAGPGLVPYLAIDEYFKVESPGRQVLDQPSLYAGHNDSNARLEARQIRRRC